MQMSARAPLMSAEYYGTQVGVLAGSRNLSDEDEALLSAMAENDEQGLYCFSAVKIDDQHFCDLVSPEFREKAIANYQVAEWRPGEQGKNSLIKSMDQNPRMATSVLLWQLGDELQKRFGISTIRNYYHKQENGKPEDAEHVFLAMTSSVNRFFDGYSDSEKEKEKFFDKNEKRGDTLEQFFGYLVARGLISRDALLTGHMLREINNVKLNAVIKELKEEGVTPIVSEPLITRDMLQGQSRYY